MSKTDQSQTTLELLRSYASIGPNLQRALNLTVQTVSTLCDADAVAILIQEDGHWVCKAANDAVDSVCIGRREDELCWATQASYQPVTGAPTHGDLQLFCDGRIAARVLWQRRGKPCAPKDPCPVLLDVLSSVAGGVIHWASEMSQDRLFKMATTDALTGLANRRQFLLRADEALARAQRTGRRCAFVAIDMDGLKSINDTQGHHAGDDALVRLAQHLEQGMRSTDSTARLGGDEFALLLADVGDDGYVEGILQRLRKSFDENLEQGLSLRFSAGVAVFPEDGDTVSELLAAADARMYAEKRLKSPGRLSQHSAIASAI